MKTVTIRSQFRLRDALRAQIEERITATVARFEDRLAWVAVQIRDVNGPKGGEDVEMVVRVRPTSGDVIVVKRIGLSVDDALSRTCGTLRKLIRQRLGGIKPQRSLQKQF